MKFPSVWKGFVSYIFGLAHYFFRPALHKIITSAWRKSIRASKSPTKSKFEFIMKFPSVWQGFVSYIFGLANYFFHPILHKMITPAWRKSLRAIDLKDLIDLRLGGKVGGGGDWNLLTPPTTLPRPIRVPWVSSGSKITKQIKIWIHHEIP